MDRRKLLAWLAKVFQTQEEEILCSECLDRIDVYVDQELDGQDAARQMPEIRRHLDQCAVCREEYELVRALAEAEAGKD